MFTLYLSPVLILVREPLGVQIFHGLDYYSDFNIKRSYLEKNVYLLGAVIKGELFETNSWDELNQKLKHFHSW